MSHHPKKQFVTRVRLWLAKWVFLVYILSSGSFFLVAPCEAPQIANKTHRPGKLSASGVPHRDLVSRVHRPVEESRYIRAQVATTFAPLRRHANPKSRDDANRYF